MLGFVPRVGLFTCLVAAICLTITPAKAADDDQRLQEFFRDHLETSFQMRPFDATLLGDHRFDHLLDDVSAKVIAVARDTPRNPPKPILETAILQNRGAVSFYEKGIFELAGDTPQSASPKEAASDVVSNEREISVRYLFVAAPSRK